jgi:hypothetical protein
LHYNTSVCLSVCKYQGSQDAQKYLHSRNGRDEINRKTLKRMERRSRKRSSSAGSEKMERVGDR